MQELSFWPRFVLAVLAAWRVTHLLAYEDGPADIIARLRALLGRGFLGRLIDCFNCLSVWVAAPLSLAVVRDWWARLLVCAALSGAACLLERVTREPVVIERSPRWGAAETSDKP
jgi:hypothetical protein